MIGFYNYTVYLTYVSLVSSFVGMYFAFSGRLLEAVICLLISGGCDMFDGKIARTKKDRTADEKNFGIQIDSLCDVVCFGVFPALIGVSVGADAWWQIAIAALFVLCGVIRLAYFNVTEETRQKTTDANRSVYNGLPITASAALVPLLMCFRAQLGAWLSPVYSVLLLVLALAYITPLHIKKPGKLGGIILVCFGVIVLAVLCASKISG